MCAWDGEWYVEIVKEGYSYSPDRMSNVAFYPLYPLLGSIVDGVTGLGAEASLLVVSQATFTIGCILLSFYLQKTRGDATSIRLETVQLCLALFPTSYFYRAAYTESLFFCLSVAILLAIAYRLPVLIVTALVALATATRFVGVAFVPIVAWYAWRRSPVLRDRIGNLTAVPFSISGLVVYAAWLGWKFGEPFAFAKTQSYWTMRARPTDFLGIVKSATIGPIMDVFDPSCAVCYWGNRPPEDSVLFNLWPINPIAFVGTLILLLIGAYKRWLTGYEAVASFGLLLIPYTSQGYRTCMASQARYALVIFPAMIVLATFIEKLPGSWQVIYFAASAALLAAYSSLFFAWYWFY